MEDIFHIKISLKLVSGIPSSTYCIIPIQCAAKVISLVIDCTQTGVAFWPLLAGDSG